jgi:hypothetical protein
VSQNSCDTTGAKKRIRIKGGEKSEERWEQRKMKKYIAKGKKNVKLFLYSTN